MHPNIIPLYDAFLMPTTKELYFVFECMEGNLYQLTKSRKGRPLASGLTASILYQIVAGLDHIHNSGYFHRDMKPENLLITTTGLADYPPSSLYALPGTPPEKDVVVLVKLADFGLARETLSRPPYTEYVSTRWYRAPEVLLRSRDYGPPVDLWALGTILVEMVTLKPVFPGDSEIDQVFKICDILGDPSADYGVDERGRVRGGGPWPRGVKMAKDVGFAFPKMPPRKMTSLFDTNVVPPQLVELIVDLLRFDPKARLTTQGCLDHAYFREVAYRYAPYRPPASSLRSAASHLSISTLGYAEAPQPSPRYLPPSHSNSSQTSIKPAFVTATSHQALPSPAHYDRHQQSSAPPSAYGEPPVVVSRHPSLATSTVSGMSAYPVQVAHESEDSPMATYPESVQDSRAPSPSSSSIWSVPVPIQDRSKLGPQFAPALHPGLGRRPSFGGQSVAGQSVAPSTLYDGSVYEGVANARPSSIMSFPISLPQATPASIYPDSASIGSQLQGNKSVESFNSQNSGQLAGLGVSGTSTGRTPSVKSGRWGSLFSSDKAPTASGSGSPTMGSQSASSLRHASSHSHLVDNPLERVPSDTSSLVSQAGSGSLDLKRGKKEVDRQAEKEAKESEKYKRESMQQAARERARAVMKKKTQLMEAADPLHNFSNQGRPAGADKGKARASGMSSTASLSSKMPQIIEDGSRLYVADLRHKSRRREEDGDVQSVSSNETSHSSLHQRGRPFSVASNATSASDPERRGRMEYDHGLTRVPSLSSISSAPLSLQPNAHPAHHLHHLHAHPSSHSAYHAPSTGHSSLDHSIINGMHSLATSNDTAGWRSPVRSESRGAHQPHERYSPYPNHSINLGLLPRSTTAGSGASNFSGQQPTHSLPPISTFDSAPPMATGVAGHLRQGSLAAGVGLQSSGASIASYRSTPSPLPSHYGKLAGPAFLTSQQPPLSPGFSGMGTTPAGAYAASPSPQASQPPSS